MNDTEYETLTQTWARIVAAQNSYDDADYEAMFDCLGDDLL
jgi:hypothetical protein